MFCPCRHSNPRPPSLYVVTVHSTLFSRRYISLYRALYCIQATCCSRTGLIHSISSVYHLPVSLLRTTSCPFCNVVIPATTDRGQHRHSLNDGQSAIHSVHLTLPDATATTTDPFRKTGLFRSYLRVPTNYVVHFNCQ
jgi:hypothetical protein